jgi:hypothetical protein
MIVNYQALINKAMLAVLREALMQLASCRDKILQENCFFVSFITHHPDVVLSAQLRSKHPDEMMVVIQHQFENLRADYDSFSITLYFDGKPESITIPYDAITSYVDKEANFALNFSMYSKQELDAQDLLEEDVLDEKNALESNVIFLDQFRK